jgi:hypothetical protein
MHHPVDPAPASEAVSTRRSRSDCTHLAFAFRAAPTPTAAAAAWRAARGTAAERRARDVLATALLKLAVHKAARSLPRWASDEVPVVANVATMRVLRSIESDAARPGCETGLIRVAARNASHDWLDSHRHRHPAGDELLPLRPAEVAVLADVELAPDERHVPADERLRREEIARSVRWMLREGGPLHERHRELLERWLRGVGVETLVAEEVGERETTLGRPLDAAEQKTARNVVDRRLSRAREAMREVCVALGLGIDR